ncbi:endosome/lysosome-associated apoptosis and autophagy regulator family member 2-like isoform X2 [Watersipora subatra]|uniref:endosome/lysosome-associated apoptosis and autophagy regulator family member 2-like isoform X2 n=1 Tax=Watersipora subatra TaxID=2589382 RepID=UPI00355C009D
MCRCGVSLLVLTICAFGSYGIPNCSEEQLHYRYTECEADNSRWRVSVPKPTEHCSVANSNVPVPGPKCGSSCPVGQYLNISGDQTCKNCPAGSYSVGNGIRYDQWETLPEDFSVSPSDSISSQHEGFNCSISSAVKTWVPKGTYLEGLPETCNEALHLTVELITDGEFSIQYFHTYIGVVAMARVESMCQADKADHGLDNFKVLPPSKDETAKTVMLKLTPGKKRLIISIMGYPGSAPGARFAIKAIEVRGMPFATECTLCRPGYYSSAGSGFCTHCPENTYTASQGSSGCLPCDAKDFAPPASAGCKPRPACKMSDYYKSIAPCENGTTHVKFSWLSPQYCNADHPDSVDLPVPGAVEDCPPCNPGQELNETTGQCSYCLAGTFSDGSQSCEVCPLHTEARRSLVFNKFNTLPDRLTTSCVLVTDDRDFCDSQSSWVPHDSYMQVSDTVDDDAFAVLHVNVSGFSKRSIDGRVYGSLKFSFEMECEAEGLCILYVMQSPFKDASLYSWNKTTPYTTFLYNFTDPNVQAINIAYRNAFKRGDIPSKSTAKVYQIELSNTKEGGAYECVDCMLGGTKDGCHSCAAGQIIVTNNVTNEKSCKKCPANHIKVDSFTCEPCGEGLVSSPDWTECISNCSYTSPDGMQFDFSSLAGIHNYKPTKCDFGYLSINFTLCSLNLASALKPICGSSSGSLFSSVHNLQRSENMKLFTSTVQEDEQSVSSLICRETILPGDSTISLQPMNLGDSLSSITTNSRVDRMRLSQKGGVQLTDNDLTIHYHYKTSQSTENCLHGLNTTVTLICDPRESLNGTKSIPALCVSGTCDGCTYDLIWKTIAACPKCELADYDRIVGECVGGSQTVHYIPHKFCPMTDKLRAMKTTQECSILTLEIKIAVGVASIVAVSLLACVICCWKRSKKLEYKYMRLVEGAQGKTGELPAAQTCAWSDDDEEEGDQVAFKTKGDQLFGKLGNRKGKTDGFEKMKLVGSSLPEL